MVFMIKNAFRTPPEELTALPYIPS